MQIKVLDGLRGYAALSIVLAHLPQISESFLGEKIHFMLEFSKLAYLGVDVFFVLSGFLITRILIKEKKENDFSFKRFYLKRSLRIFPIYYLTIVACGLIFSWEGMGYVSTYLSNYFFSFSSVPHSMRHAWSLAVEEHFYLVWPALLFLFSLDNAKKVILYGIPLLVLISLLFVYQYYDVNSANNLVYRGSQFRILSLAAGSFLAFIEPRIRILGRAKTGIIGLAFLCTYLLAIFLYKTGFTDFLPAPLILFVLFMLVSTLFFLFVLQHEGKRGVVNFLFTNDLMRYIGKISYGVYLYHFPILYYFGITHNQLDGAPISVIESLLPVTLIFLIPTVSFYLLERPLLKMKDRLSHSIS